MSAPSRNCNLEDLCPVIGYRATRVVAGWFAGRTMYVPTRTESTHPIAVLIGERNLERLVEAFPDTKIHIRTMTDDLLIYRDRRVAEAFVSGMSIDEVAALVCVTPRRVRQIKAALTMRGLIDYARLDDESAVDLDVM